MNGFDPVIFNTEGSTFANKEQAIKLFVSGVTVPKVNDFYIDFGEMIAPYFNGDRIVPNWALVQELKEERDLLSKRLNEQIRHGVVTPYFAHKTQYGETENMPEDKYYIMKTIQNENQTK